MPLIGRAIELHPTVDGLRRAGIPEQPGLPLRKSLPVTLAASRVMHHGQPLPRSPQPPRTACAGHDPTVTLLRGGEHIGSP